MECPLIVVDGFAVDPSTELDLREETWSLALGQREFGPRRLLVAFADADRHWRTLAHCRRTDPPEAALQPCIRHVGRGMAYAVALCDEPVVMGPPPPDLEERFTRAAEVASPSAAPPSPSGPTTPGGTTDGFLTRPGGARRCRSEAFPQVRARAV